MASGNIENIIIFTDVGEEIDDEIALFWFFNYVYTPEMSVTIVFTKGAANAEMSPAERYEVFQTYFPNAPTAITYIHELESMASIRDQVYDKMLQIAPLCGVPPIFFSQNTIMKLFLMGQHSGPGAVNTFKTFGKRDEGDVWVEYDAQMRELSAVNTVEIGTAISRLVPFTPSIVGKLPSEFKDQIFKKAYEQFVGRVPAFLSFCYGVTFGANYPTLLAYVNATSTIQSQYQEYKTSHSAETIEIADSYYESILTKPPTADAVGDKQKVNEMILIVQFMTGGRYLNSSLQKGPANFANYEIGQHAWITKVEANNCSLTPAYDLLAMYVMVQNLDVVNVNDAAALTSALEEAFNATSGSELDSILLGLGHMLYETGAPANSMLVGTGELTRGLVLQVKDEQRMGAPSLTGRFKLTANHQHADNLIQEHFQSVVTTDIVQNMRIALTNTKSKSFENLRSALLKEIGVHHNAELLNTHLFHPSQWTAL